METRPDQPPEGKLIAAAAERMNLSIREAAKRAGISYGRWRQIVTGYQNVSPGSYAEVRAPAKTLANMARTVGVTPDAMETEGKRPDAAEIMRATAPPRPVSTIGRRADDGPPDPEVVQMCRDIGIDVDHPETDPWIRSVREDFAKAVPLYGTDPAAFQVFRSPYGPAEIRLWNTPGDSRATKELMVAWSRAERALREAGHGRQGSAGLALHLVGGVT